MSLEHLLARPGSAESGSRAWRRAVAIILAVIVTAGAAVGLGITTARQGNLPLAIALGVLASVLVATRRVSIWSAFVFLLLFGIGLGRLYVQFGPNPLNSYRLQQGGLLAFLALAISMRLISKRRVCLPPVLLIGLVSYGTGIFASVAMTAHLAWEPSSLTGLLDPIAFGIVTFLTVLWLEPTERQVRGMLTCLLLLGCTHALLGWFQFQSPEMFDSVFIRFDSFRPRYSVGNYYIAWGRVFAVWQHAPAYGAFLATTILAPLYATRCARGRARVGAFLSLALVGSGVVLSGSITSVVSAATCGGLFVLLTMRFRPNWRTALVTLILVALAVSAIRSLADQIESAPLVSRVLDPWRGDGIGGSANARLILYDAAVRMWEGSPFWGVGLGQYEANSRTALGLSAHSFYIQMLAERGLAGVSGFLTLIAALLVVNIRVLRAASADDSKSLYLAISLASLVLLSASLTDFALNQWNFQLLFWSLQGTISSRMLTLESS